ncbi:hypothetical protein R6Z07F_001508 [Ovis aries]
MFGPCGVQTISTLKTTQMHPKPVSTVHRHIEPCGQKGYCKSRLMQQLMIESTFLHYAEVQRKTDSCGSGIAARAERRASEPAGRAASTGGDTAGPDCAGSLRRVPDFGFAAKKARAFSSHRVRA